MMVLSIPPCNLAPELDAPKVIALALLLLFGLALPTSAADIQVTGTCTLDSAIRSANEETSHDGCTAGSGADKIILTGNVTLTGPPRDVRTQITLEGNNYTIDGDNKYRFLRVADAFLGGDGNLTVQNVTLINGFSDGSGEAHVIVSYCILRLRNVNIRGSSASTGGSLILHGAGCPQSTLEVSNSTIENSTPNTQTINIADSNSNATNEIVIAHSTIISHATYAALRVTQATAAPRVKLRNSILTGEVSYRANNSVRNLCRPNAPLGENIGSLIKDGSCSPAARGDPRLGARTGSPGHYPLHECSPARDVGVASVCAAYSTDQAGSSRPGTLCDAGSIEGGARMTGDVCLASGAEKSAKSASYQATPYVPYSTCGDFTGTIIVRGWNLGTQCQVVDTDAALGDDQLRAEGYIMAVDIWGWLDAGVEVCFKAMGRATMLDSAYAPRRIVRLDAYRVDGQSCVWLDRPATVVLQHSDEPLPEQSAWERQSRSLAGCMTHTHTSLNFRRTPGGAIMGGVPEDALLTALERTDEWFYVDYHGERGWISARFVSMVGDCD